MVCSLYWSLLYLPLSDALVFIFLSPLLVAALSPFINKELPSVLVVVAMVLSLGGVAMIAQPSFLFGGQGLNRLGLLFGLMQAGFNASARMCVRDLRRTETTDIIMVYSGTMQALLALTACVTIPRSLVVPQHAWQWVLLLVTGESFHFCFAVALRCEVIVALHVAGCLSQILMYSQHSWTLL